MKKKVLLLKIIVLIISSTTNFIFPNFESKNIVIGNLAEAYNSTFNLTPILGQKLSTLKLDTFMNDLNTYVKEVGHNDSDLTKAYSLINTAYNNLTNSLKVYYGGIVQVKKPTTKAQIQSQLAILAKIENLRGTVLTNLNDAQEGLKKSRFFVYVQPKNDVRWVLNQLIGFLRTTTNKVLSEYANL